MSKQGLLLPPTDKLNADIEAVKDPQEAALLWLLRNGLRCSEAIGLKVGTIVPENGGFFVRVNGKGDKTRDVPLFESTALAVWLAVESDKWPKTPDRYVLTSHQRPQMSRKWAYLITRKHTDQHPHTLRHVYATEMVNGGVGLPVVQELLGHSSVTTTMKYYHVTRGQLFEATRRVSEKNHLS